VRLADTPWVPNTARARDWRLMLVTTIISLVGVIFFHWQIAEIVFLFFYDMIFIGMATVLRMLFAQGGYPSFWSGLLPRIIWSIAFVVLYGGMMMLLIAFTLSSLHLDGLIEGMQPIKTAMYFLAANQLFGFLFGYMANGEYKQSNFIGQLFSTMFYALPIVVLLIVVVFPNSDYFGEEHQNVWVAVAIILARTLIDFISLRIKYLVRVGVEKQRSPE
jgi:hypothetical protein